MNRFNTSELRSNVGGINAEGFNVENAHGEKFLAYSFIHKEEGFTCTDTYEYYFDKETNEIDKRFVLQPDGGWKVVELTLPEFYEEMFKVGQSLLLDARDIDNYFAHFENFCFSDTELPVDIKAAVNILSTTMEQASEIAIETYKAQHPELADLNDELDGPDDDR